jgi:phosphoribosylformimino-5-aminoimidazole carboxamide ribotide isomerase
MTKSSFQVIPVLDLKGGRAVHAVAGRRAHYQPVESILHPGSDPLALAAALRDDLGLRALYLADLDAITGVAPQVRLYQNMIALGFHLIVDAGLRDLRTAERLLALDQTSSAIVAGLETLAGPEALREILHAFGAGRIIFSLDLDLGSPRKAEKSTWLSENPLGFAREAIEQGVRQVLLLDLARVGTGRGLGTKGLLAQILAKHPDIQVSVGGGISDASEILELKATGASAVLVASAIHDGRIGRRELISLGATL